MLREVCDVRQIPGEPRRRWFSDDDFDLIVWFAEDDTITGFQLCYRSGQESKALTWHRGKGFLHCSIDEGEADFAYFKQSPILVPDGVFDKDPVHASLRQATKDIPPGLAQFVLRKIAEYPA